MSNGAIVDSTTISFSPHRGGQLRLQEDKDRKAPPNTRTTSRGTTVSCTDAVYVRLYPPAGPGTVVSASTGSLQAVGSAVEYGIEDVVMLTPDAPVHELPAGISGVRIELVGGAIGENGKPIASTVQYDAVRGTVAASVPCFRVIKVTYNAAYGLYLYKFSGACPDTPPPVTHVDASNALSASSVRYFSDGVIVAIDVDTQTHALLRLDPPECTWSSVAVEFGDTEKDAALATLMMEIDPRYPPRLVEREGGGRPYAECCIRVYPAGAVSSLQTTAGVAHKVSAAGGVVQQVTEVLEFQNSATATVKYPPAGAVSVAPVGTFKALGGSGYIVAAPGTDVVDVTYEKDGRYSNQRSRRLGPSEVCIVDSLFRHPLPSHGLARASYASTYDLFSYEFSYSGLPGEEAFVPAFVLAEDSQGRAAHLRVNGPSLDVPTKSKR